MARKEIGMKMLEGWSLLDKSCPKCGTPLLIDKLGETELCVLCGVMGNRQLITNKDGKEGILTIPVKANLTKNESETNVPAFKKHLVVTKKLEQ